MSDDELIESTCECGAPILVTEGAIELGVMCDDCAQWFNDKLDGKVKYFRVSEVADRDTEIVRLKAALSRVTAQRNNLLIAIMPFAEASRVCREAIGIKGDLLFSFGDAKVKSSDLDRAAQVVKEIEGS